MDTTRGAQRRTRCATTAVVAVALALTGCQTLRDGEAGSQPDDGVPSDVGESVPLLQVERSGGSVTPGDDFAAVPELTVYHDGRAIMHGPRVLIYPGPVLPNLLVATLDDADLAALVDAARDAGLLGETPSYGTPPAADYPTTFVTLTVDGREYRHVAEALGVMEGEHGGADEGIAADEPMPGVSDDERAARIALADFIATTSELVGAVGGHEGYVIEALGIMATPFEDDGGAVDGLEQGVAPWPVDVALAEAAECALVDGEAATALVSALAGANIETRFEQDGAVYTVAMRSLLPHELGCADLV